MKKQENKFLIYVIGGFVVAFIGLALSLVVYNATNPALTYSDMKQVDSFEETITQPEGTYLVYFYSESCPACKAIKDEIFAFAEDNNYDVPVYFVDLARVTLPSNFSEVLTNYQGTPHMEIIVNGKYIGQSASGTVEIPNLFDQINNGNVTYFD